MQDYTKGQKGLFIARRDQLDFAKNNATRALRAAEDNHSDNPSTRVHELVEFLQSIKKHQ